MKKVVPALVVLVLAAVGWMVLAGCDGGSGSAPAERASPVSGCHVRGAVRATDGSRPSGVEVSAQPVVDGFPRAVEGPPTTTTGDDGRFDLDVSSLLSGDVRVTHLDVRATAHGYVGAARRVDVASARTHGTRLFEVTLTLRPGIVVSGEVDDEHGRPLGLADVAVFRSGDEGPVAGGVDPVRPLARTSPDAEGRFHLEVAAPGRYLVVAAAADRLPAGAAVTVDGSARIEPLVLRPGVAIEGRVVYASAGVPGAWLSSGTPGVEHALSLECGGERVWWTPGDVLFSQVWTQTDASGRFRLAGLGPGDHDLRLASLEIPGLSTVSHRLLDSLTRSVAAPAHDVVVEVTGVVVEVLVDVLDTPMPDTVVRFETSGSSCRATTDVEGVVRALLAPATTYDVTVDQVAYETGRTRIDTGAAGSHLSRIVTLHPAALRPALVLSFTGPAAGTLARATLTLRDLDPGQALSFEREVKGDGGIAPFRWAGVKPGRYRLVMTPGTEPQRSGYHLPVELEVQVPPAGDVEVRIPVRVGGRLRIAARDGSGGLLNASCRILDVEGERQAVTFSTRGENSVSASSASLGGLSPAVVDPPLPAGTYTVELEMDGYEEQTVQAVVKENETTDVDVTLPRR